MKALVGKTGFVGSNLWASGAFSEGWSSKDIQDAYGLKPDVLVYAGVRAEKYLANRDAEADWKQVHTAIDNIHAISPKQLVLISTVDVYPRPQDVDEDSAISTDDLQPYGRNRYRLEQTIRQDHADALIVRLPALYGRNIKKNFIYDMLTIIPHMLSEAKYRELAKQDTRIKASYVRQENGFYQCVAAERKDREILKESFQRLGFTALNFTDSRAVYQFYPLQQLWTHIEMALRSGIKLLNLATEPIQAAELYHFVYGTSFDNEIQETPPFYDFKTKYDSVLGGRHGYVLSKTSVMEGIREFVEAYGK